MAASKTTKSKSLSNAKKGQVNALPIYVFLIIVFVLYLLLQRIAIIADILGIVLLLGIISVIVLETMNGVKEEGYVKNILELVAVVVIVLLVWFGLKFILQTPYPIDVVPSCSMLPNLQRGSILLLDGVSGVNGIKAPIVNVTQSQYDSMAKNQNKEFMSCVSYIENGSRVSISQYLLPGYTIGLYESSPYGGSIIPNSSQESNLVQYDCGVAQDKLSNGSTTPIVITTAIKIDGTIINGDRNNSIVVYSTVPQDVFYQEGDNYIVHRLYAVLNVSGKYYFLTKGDNNPGLDMQYGNYPSNSSLIEGKVIASVPYLGYLKLILSNSFSQPQGCNTTIINS